MNLLKLEPSSQGFCYIYPQTLSWRSFSISLNGSFRRSTGKKEGRVYHARSLHHYSALPCSNFCSCGPPIWDLHGQSQTQGKGKPLPYQASCSLNTQYNTLGYGGIKLKLSCQVSSPILVLQAAEESAALYTWRAPYPIASSIN